MTDLGLCYLLLSERYMRYYPVDVDEGQSTDVWVVGLGEGEGT